MLVTTSCGTKVVPMTATGGMTSQKVLGDDADKTAPMMLMGGTHKNNEATARRCDAKGRINCGLVFHTNSRHTAVEARKGASGSQRVCVNIETEELYSRSSLHTLSSTMVQLYTNSAVTLLLHDGGSCLAYVWPTATRTVTVGIGKRGPRAKA